jgi:transposase
VIPAKQNAEFVACMEDVLDLYELAYDADCPVVCMDEQPVQLIAETRPPIPAKPGVAAKYDYEYRRMGTAVNFMFTEPLKHWRKVNVRRTKAKKDWAEEIRELLDMDYPEARKVILVCDNLNTHTYGALYEAFEPAEARRLAKRLEIHYTPKHGSWLNVAEIELSLLTRRALHRRIESFDVLVTEAGAWADRRNAEEGTVRWQFRTDKARIKLLHLYPETDTKQ